MAMCANKQCPQFKHCYRAQAIPNLFAQSYAEFKPDTIGRCEYYWPFKENKNAS